MIVQDVMQALADRANTIDGLRCFAYPPDKANPPVFLVELPEEISFDGTYGRGMDSLTIPAVLLVGRSQDRTSVKNLLPYIDGSGAKSIKAVLESANYTAMDTVHVSRCELATFTFADVSYLGAEFTINITGSGE